MSENNRLNTWAGSLLLASGAIIGAGLALFYVENRPMKAGVVLQTIKDRFRKEGKVLNGSWIDYDPIEYELFESRPLVYIGGISRQEEGQEVRYQFAADAYSGELVDLFRINS